MNIFLFFVMLWLLVSCQRSIERPATLKTQMPAHPQISEKAVNTLAAEGQKVCYFLSVNGPGIEADDSTCSPSNGISTGFVEPLSLVEIEVLNGEDRQVDVYLLLLPAGQTCADQGVGLQQVAAIAVGPQAGRKVLTLQTLPAGDPGQAHAPGNVGGFSLHAGVAVRANQRNKRERLCRYISRPAYRSNACHSPPVAKCVTKSKRRTTTAPHTLFSRRWIFWRGWPRWFPGRG